MVVVAWRAIPQKCIPCCTSSTTRKAAGCPGGRRPSCSDRNRKVAYSATCTLSPDRCRAAVGRAGRAAQGSALARSAGWEGCDREGCAGAAWARSRRSACWVCEDSPCWRRRSAEVLRELQADVAGREVLGREIEVVAECRGVWSGVSAPGHLKLLTGGKLLRDAILLSLIYRNPTGIGCGYHSRSLRRGEKAAEGGRVRGFAGGWRDWGGEGRVLQIAGECCLADSGGRLMTEAREQRDTRRAADLMRSDGG